MVHVRHFVSQGRSWNRKNQVHAWHIRWIWQIFHYTVYLTSFLLLASLWDEADAPDHHGDMEDIVLNSPRGTTASTSSRSNRSSSNDPPKIAYAVSLTGCGGAFNQTTADPNARSFQIAEGAAVLAHSIHRASSRDASSGLGGRYDYELVAIYHPDAEPCVGILRELGYRLIRRDVFVEVEEIQGDFLRETIRSSGCCGEKELIKMEAYALLEYPLVLIVDLDCLIFKPLDTLFDYMLHNIAPPPVHLQRPNNALPSNVSLLYTLDYAVVSPARKIKPIQGGFLLIRPDMEVYEELRSIMKEGDYRKKGGWAGKTGKYWGGHTVQGLLPYYYLVVQSRHPAVEVNRCIYNNMVPKARTGEGVCFSQEEPCQDCQQQPLDTILSTHFTNCEKPWHCQRQIGGAKLCRAFHHAWFKLRAEMEKSWGRAGHGSAPKWADYDHFFGYCQSRGSKGYKAIEKPYGLPTAA